MEEDKSNKRARDDHEAPNLKVAGQGFICLEKKKLLFPIFDFFSWLRQGQVCVRGTDGSQQTDCCARFQRQNARAFSGILPERWGMVARKRHRTQP
jgi:hypothetical protein